MNIVILGGTGLIGKKLHARLAAQGHHVIPASPSTGVDILTGAGLPEVLRSADVVVDVVNSPSFEDAAVLRFFETAARHILPAEAAAGVRHHLALSVVGADRLPESGYMRAKVAQERAIQSSSVPHTILRATQFFEFIGAIANSGAEGDTIRVTSARFQPVAAADVAATLATLAAAPPANGIVELAGPEASGLDDFVRRYLGAKKDPRRVVSDRQAPYFGALLDDASLTPGANPHLGATRLEEWLASA
ncbi:SDR family oxidoreductase [Sorangium sp. So ce131]|uniref:SDR family oxidoreductase n=1 Tax=Sorangium sp. So ce131 TaxID=3133282 RepID=UPI003F613812